MTWLCSVYSKSTKIYYSEGLLAGCDPLRNHCFQSARHNLVLICTIIASGYSSTQQRQHQPLTGQRSEARSYRHTVRTYTWHTIPFILQGFVIFLLLSLWIMNHYHVVAAQTHTEAHTKQSCGSSGKNWSLLNSISQKAHWVRRLADSNDKTEKTAGETEGTPDGQKVKPEVHTHNEWKILPIKTQKMDRH